jgi:hypothetical protein
MLGTKTKARPAHEALSNGVAIVRTPTGVGVEASARLGGGPVRVEVRHGGRVVCEDVIRRGELYRNYLQGLDMLACAVRVYDGETLLAELPAPGEPLPFMVLQGEQRHITESSVSVPPALTITDPRGDVWTLGFERAPEGLSPEGEFAFAVLRNGKCVGETASRIEMRGGRVRILTHTGWKRLSHSGREFI